MNRPTLNRPTCRLILTLLTAALAVAPVTAQDADPVAGFGEAVEVSEVLLDVLVTDEDGNVVVGLGPEDFVVEEDGERVPVTAVSFYSNRIAVDDAPPGVLPEAAPDEVPADRYFILFLDDQRLHAAEAPRLLRRQLEAANKAQEWVAEEMLPGDWVAVAGYDYKLKVYLDFSQDREAIRRALEDAARGKDPGNEWPSRRPDDATGPSLLADLPQGKELRDETTRIYDALRLLAEATGDIVGRKNLLLFTIGFGDVERGAGPSLYTRPDPRFYPELREALNDNNVAVYPIDLTPPEIDHAQTDFLHTLAADTGGTYHRNIVSFMTPLQQIADEASGYYLLSFETEHPAGESGYREVEVRAANPRFDVQAREGYRYGSAG